MAKFNELLGETLKEIKGAKKESDEVIFITESGKIFRMWHCQDCCENVLVDDVVGDTSDLIGTPITLAEESSSQSENGWGSETWTFYKLATIKGYVDFKWYGESNGYYSEEVDFDLL